MKLGIHTEALWRTLDKMKVESKKRKMILFCTTPANYEYSRGVLGFDGSKEELSRITAKAIKELSKTAEIQLHLHLSAFPEWIEYSEQEKMFKEAIEWMKKQGFNVNEVVFGWWRFDSSSVKLCKKYGLKIITKKEYPAIHDYDSFAKKNILRAYLRMIKARLKIEKEPNPAV